MRAIFQNSTDDLFDLTILNITSAMIFWQRCGFLQRRSRNWEFFISYSRAGLGATFVPTSKMLEARSFLQEVLDAGTIFSVY